MKTFFKIKIILSISLFATSFIDSGSFKKAPILFYNAFAVENAKTIFTPNTINELQQFVKDCNDKKQKVSIAGAKKSQGGQTFAHDAIQVNMSKLNRIGSIDLINKTITVQTGISWQDIQKCINNFSLSIKSMQSYNSFSVGGSLSVNAHGQDIHNTCIASTILSFRFLLANGEIINIEKDKDSEIFNAVLGGYGFLGIITDATIQLTDDKLLNKKVKQIHTVNYKNYFVNNIKDNAQVALHSARLSINPDTLFDTVLSITYFNTNKVDKNRHKLITNKNILRDQLMFDLLRKYKWVKKVRLFVEKYFVEKSETISRNNAMGSTLESLENKATDTTDILQEYFVPVNKLTEFLSELKKIIIQNNINLLNATIRYIKPNDTILSYAQEESFGIVLFINVKKDKISFENTKKWTQEIIYQVLKFNGKYYLPYHLFATKEQFNVAYPNMQKVYDLKNILDPNSIFTNELNNFLSK